jgi:hypothetical protein
MPQVQLDGVSTLAPTIRPEPAQLLDGRRREHDLEPHLARL